MKLNKELENAVLIGDINLIKTILKQGSDLNIKDNFGRTIIYDAIVKGFDEVVEILCESNAQINIFDKDGKTPLHFAAIHQKFQIAKFLIYSGADVNAKDIYGNTPLGDAVFYSKGMPDIIVLLIENRADYNIQNNYGISPKTLAETISNFDVSYLFKQS